MKQKIEWYREVLEIEPNSKIFFPLARMLTKDGRNDESITVLRQGVGRHPDHVEARLLLVEQLYICGKAVELQQELTTLSDLFKQYPNFWRAWGESLFDEEETRDAGLAAIFLAAFLQNLPVSWAGIIEHGLKSLVGEGATSRPSASAVEVHPLSPLPELKGKKETTPETPISFATTAPSESVDELDTTVDDDDDELITIRTRSMAEVLAEQGDIPGALDIYAELIAAAPDVEKTELHARMDVLSRIASGEAQAGKQGPSPEGDQEEKKDWLSILAQRLEARSLQ